MLTGHSNLHLHLHLHFTIRLRLQSFFFKIYSIMQSSKTLTLLNNPINFNYFSVKI